MTNRAQLTVHWVLRVGVAMCFIGHGAFGIITKAAWLPYFAVAGIPAGAAFTLMPWIGAVDITVGVLTLIAPSPLLLAYAAFWTAWTALLRPLAGEPLAETLERAGNYGVPIALLLSSTTGGGVREWVRTIAPAGTSHPRTRLALTVATVLLLAGHGLLGIAGKPVLASHYAAAGLPPVSVAVGWSELALAAAVALRPSPALFITVCLWKLSTESLWLVAGSPVWEFVERGGSYAAPLAAAVLARNDLQVISNRVRRGPAPAGPKSSRPFRRQPVR